MNKVLITRLGLFVALLSGSCFQGFSQQQSNAIAQVNIASPNASALGKFVDIPVNYHTGIPSIGVSIYTIKSGSLQLPIGLSYHAGGLKVQEQSSWVGAGWALNAGGVITRTVRGTPDERMASSTFQKFGYLSDSGVLNYMFKSEDGTPRTQFVTGQEFAEGRHDGEPDLFFFNFNGYSGKFYINDDRTPVLFPEQDIKIEYDYTPGTWNGGPGAYAQSGRCIEGFTITTPDGTKYYFGMAGGNSPSLPNVQPIEVVSIYSLNSGSTFSRSISSWYLNKIVSADGNSAIYLSYTRDSYAYCIANASNPTGSFTGDYSTYDLVKNLMDGVKLNQISFATGTVNFIAGAARQDLSGWSQGAILSINDAVNTISPSLSAIQISDNSPTGFCKKFTLSQSYFTDNTTPLPAFLSGITLTADKKRLKLDSLKESSCDGGVVNPPYKFDYNTELVPRTVCFNFDHWGFINGAANTDLLPSLTKNGAAYITTTNSTLTSHVELF